MFDNEPTGKSRTQWEILEDEGDTTVNSKEIQMHPTSIFIILAFAISIVCTFISISFHADILAWTNITSVFASAFCFGSLFTIRR